MKEQQAFETLRDKMVSKPMLQQPNFNKMFYLQTNTSKYRVGAVLLQDGATKGATLRKQHPIMYYSATFSPTEQNYNVHNLEFLGVLKSIKHWRLYLIWTKKPFVIETDHKNLTYWKSPRKLTGRTAQWHKKLQDYNFKILHIAGKNNTPTNALSYPSDDEREVGEQQLLLLPQEAFLNLAKAGDSNSLKAILVSAQQQYRPWLKARQEHAGWKEDQG